MIAKAGKEASRAVRMFGKILIKNECSSMVIV